MDLVQSVHRTVFLGMKGNRFHFDSPGQFIALITTLVRRKTAKQWRKHRRQQRQSGSASGDFDPAEVLIASRADLHPGDEVAMRDQLHVILEQLDETDRRLVELRLEGYSTAEAARMLNLDPDSMRVRLSRLRKRLKQSSVFNDFV